MTESYLMIDIPMEHNNWESVYKFVTLIGNNRGLLFTRDVFYAKLGLLLCIPVGPTFVKAIINARIETIELLLDLSELQALWRNRRYILMATEKGRYDVALLLAKDCGCLVDNYAVVDVVKGSLDGGCSKTFFYLVEKYHYGKQMPFDFVGTYEPIAACYDLEGVVLDIKYLSPQHSEDYKTSKMILKFVRAGGEGPVRIPLLGERLVRYTGAVIKGGHLITAYKMSTYDYIDRIIYESIVIGIRNGTITDWFELKPYIDRDPELPGIVLSYIVEIPYIDLRAVRYLASFTSGSVRTMLVERALKCGNWEYAKVISEFL